MGLEASTQPATMPGMFVRWPVIFMWALAAGTPAWAFAQTPPDAPADPILLNLAYHADVMGRLAIPSCGGEGEEPPSFAALVSVMDTLRKRSDAHKPLALLGGNSLAPGLFARGILARKGYEGAQALVAMFKQAGYSALALGHHDLGLERVRLERFAQAAHAQNLPLVATNLRCEGPPQPLCQYLNREVIVEHGGRNVAILSVLSPLVQTAVARSLRQGLVIDPPLVAIAAALKRLEARGDVSAVVLMTQMPGTKAARQELENLQRALGQKANGLRINVILAGGLSTNADKGVLRVLRQDGGPTIVGSSPDTQSVAWVQVSRGFRVSVETLATAQAPEEPTTRALMAPYIERYCTWYGDPLAPAAVAGALTRDEFLTYLLSIMRKQARAEVALLNRGFVKPDVFPLRGRIRRAELYRAIPYRAQVGVVRLHGADVEKLLGPALANDELARLGIEGAPGALRINGRPLDKARGYRVATIEFVANGGDDVFEPGVLAFRPIANGDLRQQVEGFLASQTGVEDNNPDVSVERDFGPPASERMLWVWISDLTLDLNNTSITGTRATMPSQGYNAPQLTRAEQRAARAQFNNVVQLRSLRHEGDLRLYGEFGYSRNQPQGKPAVGAETSDLLQLSGLYSYKGLRDTSLPVPKAAVPDPYVRAFLESEFTRPAQRPYRHAELTATLGAQFSVLPKLRVRGGPGLRQQLLADGPQGRLLPLLEAGAIMDPVGMPLISGLVARLEGWVDYVYVDPADLAQHQLKLQSRLSVPLVPTLFLTVGADVYASKAGGRGWAAAVDTLVGLRAHFDAARQRL